MARRREQAVLEPVIDAATLRRAQEAMEDVAVEDSVAAYMVDLTAATRSHKQVQVGASPRGSLALLLTARARAVLAGRTYVTPEDVKTVAPAALAHRISLKPEMWLRQVDPGEIVAEVCQSTPAPASELLPAYRTPAGAGPPDPDATEDEGVSAPDDPVYRYVDGGRR
jgi:MoxR-like ATPase